mgnify:CR=1 FL=1
MVLKDSHIENEPELEEILINSPESIEEGFRLLRNQRRTTPGRKRMDLLGVDSKGTLTVVELKVEEDDGQLQQAIEYFDWLLEKGVSFFRDYFPNLGIENRTPRIILVAPEFGERTIKMCKYVSEDIQISLRKYFCFELDGKKQIRLVDVAVPPKNEIEEPPTNIMNHINWIKDDRAREVFEKAIEDIKGLDPGNIRETLLPYRINFIHTSTGLKFAELYSRRSYFLVDWKEPEEWEERKVASPEEWEAVLNDKVKKALELVKKK